MNRYSDSSETRLKTCHHELQTIFRWVLPHFDHSILCGHRNEQEQERAYLGGKSKVHYPESRHNSYPAMAVDAGPYDYALRNVDYDDVRRLNLFAGYVLGVAQFLLEEGSIEHRIRWGGDWDMDTAVKDNKFNDLVHFELIDP